MIPFTTPPVYPPTTPTRFASLIKRAGEHTHDDCRIGLIGLPDDTGVTMNGGRPGAKDGPRAFREALARFGTGNPMLPARAYPGVYDCGDVTPGDSLYETHDRVTHAVQNILDAGLFPVAIGGGHDLTFPFVRAAVNRAGVRCGIYFDAHLDVREEPGSGMPFRSLIQQCAVERLVCIGAEPLVNSAEHGAWFLTHGGLIVDRRQLAQADAIAAGATWPDAPLFVSLDMDVFPAADAPGVSATNPVGVSPSWIEHLVHRAGSNTRVACFDIMELNPAFDQDQRTARLAVCMFLTFLQGFALREG